MSQERVEVERHDFDKSRSNESPTEEEEEEADPKRDEYEDLEEYSDHQDASVASLSSFFEATTESVSGSDYASIGVDESDKSVDGRRRLLHSQNRELRRSILAALKNDIAAASAKMFVTLKILSHSLHISQDALRDLERSRRNLVKMDDATKSLTLLGTNVLPDWR